MHEPEERGAESMRIVRAAPISKKLLPPLVGARGSSMSTKYE